MKTRLPDEEVTAVSSPRDADIRRRRRPLVMMKC